MNHVHRPQSSRAKHGAANPKQRSWTETFARLTTEWTGSTSAFILAVGVIVVWMISGPIFQFSDTWQLVINTGTTIVTFLMVFLIQRAQNADSRAIHLKLNELIAALSGASSRLVNVEDLSEEELRVLHQHYEKLAGIAGAHENIRESHSIEEAEARQKRKQDEEDDE